MNKKQAWVTPFIVILSVFTAAAIILGVAIHTMGFVVGSGKSLSETIAVSADVKELEVDLSLGDLKIVYGNEASVSYNYPEEIKPVINSKGGKLKIENKKSAARLNGNRFKDKYSVVITLPKDKVLDNVSIDMDLGNCVFDELSVAGDVTFNIDLGNVEVATIRCTNLTADLDLGNFEINQLICDSVDASLDMGNVEIKKANCDHIKAKADMGNVEVYGSYASIEARCSMGNVEVSSDNPDTVFDVKTDMGNCSVNGVVHKKK